MNHGWAVNQLERGLGLRPGERVLVLVDEPLRAAGEALCATARALGAGLAELRVVPGAPGAGRPALAVVPAAFLRQVTQADAIISLMSGFDLQRESPLLRAGLAAFRAAARGRWAAGACIDQAVLEEDLAVDCQAIAAQTAATAARLAQATQVRLVTEAGTDLTFSIAGRPVHQDPGALRTPGAYGNLPAGEAFVAPLETSAEGRVVIDLSLGDIPLDGPVTLTFQGGRAVAVQGGGAARELERRLGSPEARPGPGPNPP
ncbi:MAG: putative aminopeptidase, partial [Symbiobacteriaceae bacterium]|nr:putative aminopeptidase [Symbiobacteriaceae bacterium]